MKLTLLRLFCRNQRPLYPSKVVFIIKHACLSDRLLGSENKK